MLASLSDLAEVLGRPLDGGETGKALRALRFASALAQSHAPWADWDPVPVGVADAVAALAARKFSARADGATMVGPFQYGRLNESFTGEELAIITSSAPATGGSYSVSIAGPDD